MFPGDANLGWVDSPLRDLTVLSAGSHAGSSPGFLVGAERGGRQRALQAQRALLKELLEDEQGIFKELLRKRVLEEAGGRYIPVFKVLPSPHRQLETGDETES